MRLQQQDRFRHIDGREGTVTEVLPSFECKVRYDDGGVEEVIFMGFLEKIPAALTASGRVG